MGPLTLQYKSGQDAWTTGLTISETGLATFAGNVDATNGLDVTTANLTVGGSNFSVAPGTGNVTTAGTVTLPNTNTLTGVANYTQFSQGVSFGGATTYNIANTGAASLLSGTFAAASNQLVLGTTNTLTLTSAQTSSHIITFPDATGTVCLSGSVCYGPSSGQFGFWQLNAGVLAPFSTTADLAIGGTATASALFHVYADTGNLLTSGTASVAGIFTAGNVIRPDMGPLTLQYKSGQDAWTTGLTISETGLATFAGNVDATNGLDVTTANLTVGGSNFSVAPGTGNVTTAGTVTLPNTNTLTGVANYTQFSQGVSFGGATTYNIANTGAASLLSGTFAAASNQLVLGTTNTLTLTSAQTSSHIITFPDATGTVCLSGSVCYGPSSGQFGFWQLNAGVLAPFSTTADLAIGGTATSSAIFSVEALSDYDMAYNPANAGTFTITSNLASGGRTSNVMEITQANDGSNNSTGNLLKLSQSDVLSSAAVLEITQAAGPGTGILINMDGIGSGRGINIGSYDTGASGQTNSMDLLILNDLTSNSMSGTAFTDSVNLAELNRSITNTHASGSTVVDGDVLKIASSLTETAGSISDSSNLVSLAQNCGANADCTGSVIELTNAGTGNAADFFMTNTGGTQTNGLYIYRNGTGGTTTNAINIAQNAGTLTNGINFSAGTIGTGITFDAADLTTEIVLENAETISNQTDGRIGFGNGSINLGYFGVNAAADGGILYLDPGTTPANCTVGEMYSSGTNIYYCEATDTWVDLTVQSGGANYWQLSATGSLSPFSLTADVNLGATATASAKISLAGSLDRGMAAAIINQTEAQDILTASLSGSTRFTVSSTGDVSLISGTATADTFKISPSATAGTAYTGTLTTADLTAARIWTLPDAGGTLGLSANDFWQRTDGSLAPSFVTDDLNVGATATASAFLNVAGLAATTGNAMTLNVNSLTTGNAFSISGTGTALTSGRLFSLDWSPSSPATASGDLFRINIGVNGDTTGNLLNITDNGSSLFSVSTSQMTSNIPAVFTAAGDVSFSYDINMTNQTSSQIESLGPFTINVGESHESNNLTLRTYNAGNILLDVGTGGVGIGTAVTPAGLLTISGAKVGQALVQLNETGDQNILTASASGATVMKLDRTGSLTLGTASANAGSLVLQNASNANTVTLVSGVTGTTYSMTLPTGQSSGSQYLMNNGSGTLSWGTPSGTNFWQLVNSDTGLAPLNADIQDLFIGGTATGSARFQVEGLTGNTFLYSGTATADTFKISPSATAGTAYTGTLTTADLTAARIWTLPDAGGTLGLSANDFWQRTDGSLAPSYVTDDLNIGATATASAFLNVAGLAASTGNAMTLNVNSLTTGNAFSISGTGTALTSGRLLSLDWSPSSAATASGDLFRINIGANGDTTGNLLNITDNGSSLFSVSTSQVISNLPTAFNNAGDVTMAYDLNFSNQTSSNIKTKAPFTIEVGDNYESNNLTLKTYNSGNIVFDLGTGAVLPATDSAVDIGATSSSRFKDLYLSGAVYAGGSLIMSDGSIYQDQGSLIMYTNQNGAKTAAMTITDSGKVLYGSAPAEGILNVYGSVSGKAMAIFNITNTDQNILTASVSGSTRFVLGNNGDLNLYPYNTGAGNTSELRFRELAAGGSEYVGFKGPDAITTSVIWTLPNVDSSGTQCLSSNGAGVFSWSSCGGGTGTSKWQLVNTNTGLASLNTTQDLFVGDTATASAYFTAIGTPATTNNAVAIIANSVTSGTGLKITNTGTTLTGNLLDVSSTMTTNNGVLEALTANSLTTGTGGALNISTTGLNGTGYGIKVTGPSGATALTNGLVQISAAGAYTGTGGLLNLTSGTATGNVFTATASAITTGNIVQLGQGGNSAFSGNVVFADIDNTGAGGNGFSGNFLKFNKANNTLFTVDSNGDINMYPYGTATGNTSELRFRELAAGGSEYVGFKGPDAITTSVIWTLPNVDSSGTQCLSSNGAGVFSWSSCGGGTGTSKWQLVNTNTGLASLNTTQDLFVGDTATASAYFTAIGTPATTNNAVSIIASSLTTGSGLRITGSAATMATGGELVDLVLGANTVGAGVTVTSTGVYTGTGAADGLINVVANSLTTGDGSKLSFTGLTSGTGMEIIGGTSMTTNGELLDLNMGAATAGNGATITTSGIYTGTGLLNLAANSATGGNLLAVGSSGTGLTGSLLSLTTGSTAAFTNGAFYLNASGAHTGSAALLSSGTLTGNILTATASAITTGNIVQLGQGGNSAFSGNVLFADIDNTGAGGNGFSGNFLKFNKANNTLFTVDSNGDINMYPYHTDSGDTAELRFRELAAGGSEYVGFKGPDAITTSRIWTLPNVDSTGTQCLSSNGSGVLSWSACSSGSGSSNWQETGTGALTQRNIMEDVLLGATATSSARVVLPGSLTRGKAAVIINQLSTDNMDLLTASAAGTTRFRLTYAGELVLNASSYLNFGTTAGASGYGIRDNSGVMQLRNSAGNWTNIASESAAFERAKYDRVVDANGGGTDTTVAAAITNAPTGGSIFISPGTYSENITVTKALKFYGAGSDRTSISGGSGSATVSLSDGIDDIEFHDMTITNAGITQNIIDSLYSSGEHVHLVFENLKITNGLTGMNLYEIFDSKIINSLFSGQSDHSIWTSTASTGNIISGNTFENIGNGVGSEQIIILGFLSVVSNNYFIYPTAGVKAVSTTGTGGRDTITGNVFDGYGTGGTAITVTGNNTVISGNSIYDIDTTSGAIDIYDSDNFSITGNTISSVGDDDGIYINDNSNTHGTITGNTITGCAGYAIDLGGSTNSNMYVSGNNLLGNTAGTIENNTGNGNIVEYNNSGSFDLAANNPGKAALILNGTGAQNLFAASASGATRFVLGNNGDINMYPYNTGAGNTAELQIPGTGCRRFRIRRFQRSRCHHHLQDLDSSQC